MKETQQTITAWARSQFGPGDVLTVATRMNCEVAELLAGLAASGPAQGIAEELADVGVMLLQVAELQGFSLLDKVHEVTPHLRTYRPEMMNTYCSRLAANLSEAVGQLLALLFAFEVQHSYQEYKNMTKTVFVGVVLFRLAEILAVDLEQAIDEKMEINRNRKWGKNDNGTYQHV
jgi:NTP pyrophosphatase (non-canonical NTP hydrolase)